jgi:hypothetical protein
VGVVLAAVPLDFDGVSRASRDDIGAYQYAGAATTPPALATTVISAVSSTGVGQSSATIVWTTNNAANSQVAYGLTSAYGSSTTLNASPVTSHSVPLGGLTAGTVYHYQVLSRDSGGTLVTSPDATFTTAASAAPAAPAVPAGCVLSANTWQNVALTAQTGSFTAQFDATPATANTDGLNGLSNGAASAFTSQAAAVRFNDTGMIDARNGGAYAAAASIPYVAGMSYHFTLVVSVGAHTYSAYVKQGSNAQQLIGSNYAFRTEQAAVATLNNLGVMADIGSQTTCNAAVTALTPTVISAVSAMGLEQTMATIGWTTNNPADSQVQYGPTTAYGVMTTLNSTPTTSHSVSLGGLTAGTVYHYQVMSRDAAGNLVTSPDATFTTAASAAPAAPACVTSAGSSWQNVPLTTQTGSFTASFDATPSTAKEDGVIGLSNGAASAFTSQAAAVRFNNTGTIDARNGGVYAASASIPYSAGLSYHFQLVVNLSAHTYSAYVTQGASAQRVIGLNYAFRTEQKGAALLNDLGAIDDTVGSVTVCNVVP